MFETPTGGIRLPEPSRAMLSPSHASRGHFTGQFVFGPGPGRLEEVESHLEILAGRVLLANPDVADLEEQVAFAWHNFEGEEHTHFFDFLVHLRNETRLAIAVKTEQALLDGNFPAQMAEITKQVEPWFAHGVRILTEKHLNPIDLHNAELFHGVRELDPEADVAAESTVAGLAGAVRLQDLIQLTGFGARAFRAFIRLLALSRFSTHETDRGIS